MAMLIVIAGATGNLGGRIARELRQRGAHVRAIVRAGAEPVTLAQLRNQGIEVVPVDYADGRSLAQALTGADCVVSALLGLEPTLIGTQGAVLLAAVEVGVPRFIPSDYSMDFTKIAEGDNRNFDIHRKFQRMLDDASIRSTTILNGCFTDLLTGGAPLILAKLHRVLYWGENPEQIMDFTTIDDTAAFTAEVALDPDTPRFLRIAGEQVSARGLAEIAEQVSGQHYRLLRGGALRRLRTIISVARKISPNSDATFPIWQGMQYLYCMFEGSGKLIPLDNNRYSGLNWTGVAQVLAKRR